MYLLDRVIVSIPQDVDERVSILTKTRRIFLLAGDFRSSTGGRELIEGILRVFSRYLE